MILTCNRCPTQLAFAGSDLAGTVQIAGWRKVGKRFVCRACVTAPRPAVVTALTFEAVQ